MASQPAVSSRSLDPVSDLENALGAEILRLRMLGHAQPMIADRYIIEGVLGRGASGLVLAALDRRLNRPVALKARPAIGDSAALAEARTLARLDHPNVVRVHDVDVVTTSLDGRDFQLWLVSMARVDGRNMRDWLRESTRSPAEILTVLVDVGRGIAAAHGAGIVHRDVKPDNVIVRTDGAAQVLDFGFAVQAASGQSDVGGVRPAAGTDPYMAPEARLGLTSRKSDQFSLGVTLVEALTGAPMPAGRRIPRGVPEPIWRIAQRATSPDREDRYGDMSAMVKDMARAARLPTRTRIGPVVGAAVGVAALAGLGALLAWPGATQGATNRLDAAHLRVADAGPHADAPGVDVGIAFPERDSSPLEDGRSIDAGSLPADPPVPIIDVSALPENASTRPRPCTLHSGTYAFVTRPTSGRDRTQGRYVLGIDARRRRPIEVSVRRVEPVADHLHVRSVEVRPDCQLHFVAQAEHRSYEFWLLLEGQNVRGRFSATGNPGYVGEVKPSAP